MLFLGEAHCQPEIKREFQTELFPAMVKKGFTHFAIESFSSCHQQSFNSFGRGELSRNALKSILESGIASHQSDTADFYLDIAQMAIAQGLKVVGIERQAEIIPKEDLNGFDWPAFKKECPKNEAGSWSSFIFYRNCFASMILQQLIQWPTVKIAVFGGMVHYGYFEENYLNISTLNYLMKKLTSIDGAVIYLMSTNSDSPFKWQGSGRPAIIEDMYDKVDKASLGDERFCIDTSGYGKSPRPDFLVHMP